MSKKRALSLYVYLYMYNYFFFFFKNIISILSISLYISTLTNTLSTLFEFSFTLFTRYIGLLGYTPRFHVAAPGGKCPKMNTGGAQSDNFWSLFWLFCVQQCCICAHFVGSCVDFCVDLCRPRSAFGCRYVTAFRQLVTDAQCPYEYNCLCEYADTQLLNGSQVCLFAYANMSICL
jgi:hypothetical protein